MDKPTLYIYQSGGNYLHFPADLSADGLADLLAWLEFIIERLNNRAQRINEA